MVINIFNNLVILLCFTGLNSVHIEDDPYLWLEEIRSDSALSWVKKQNNNTLEELSALPVYNQVYNESLSILNSKDRIVSPTVYGDWVYNFWKSKEKPRGVWRRTRKSTYIKGNPKWEIMLDIDSLCKVEDKTWTWKGTSALYPDYKKFLIWLSPGGGDANIAREYNSDTKTFVKDGFNLPLSKGGGMWIDGNTILVNRNFGEGTLTVPGYARQARLWKRNTRLEDSEVIYEIPDSNMGVFIGHVIQNKKIVPLIYRVKSRYRTNFLTFTNNQLYTIPIPDHSSISTIAQDQLIFQVKYDFENNGTTYKKGSLLSSHWNELLKGTVNPQLVLEPGKSSSIHNVTKVNNKLVVHLVKNVKSSLYSYTREQGEWQSKLLPVPQDGTISISDISEKDFFYYYNDFTTPYSLNYMESDFETGIEIAKRKSAFADSLYQSVQYKAVSKDGTEIPYFVVMPKGKFNKPRPTLLYAYGGFEVSRRPFYLTVTGKSWLERGGVYVLANIRGGGEFGPEWHQAGLKENRQRVFDDFHAVAEDLIQRGITTPKQLGIKGGSNGGLLVGVAFTQRPDLYGAVVCEVPLLDMKRYNKLLAGASWMAEYGNPDKPEEWDYIKKYSPYHNLKPNTNYPTVFFNTSTSDDRVHPAHARKMAAKMMDMGYKVYYYEDFEGGHNGNSTHEQSARSYALLYTYLYEKLNQ
ncbi:MAG: prolyl oligopeptidase family serine peptidase [Bacteroidales bacterium]|nr:prolyl oligopeptidase family serine peptidase [Bacteroidales bacterium]